MQPRDYQIACGIAVREALACHDSTLVEAATGVGKCLGKGTPILMHDGTIKPVEQVAVGDLLMGPDSRPRQVLSLARGRENLYRVVPVKGMDYVVNESHILSLKLTPRRHGDPHRLVNTSVRDYLASTPYFKHLAKGWRAAVDWPERDVPLHPYLLGLWLGDGSTNSPQVSKPDPEVEESMRAFAGDYGLQLVAKLSPGKCPTWALSGRRKVPNPVYTHLRQLGVVKERHVPLLYRANARTVRLEILAGLLDSDGSFSNGGFDYISKDKRLAEDVAFLCRSLGLAAYMTPCEKSCQGGFTGSYFRVGISGDCSVIPTRISRKQAPRRRQIKDVTLTGISVEPVGIGDYYGFAIDGDRLFLLGDFTVTHNTLIFCHLARDWPGRVMIVAHREELIRQAAGKVIAVTGDAPGIEMAAERSDEAGLVSPPKIVIASVQTLAVAGRLAKFRPDDFGLLIIDEAHHVVAPSYRRVIDHFSRNPACKRLGVTATPKRADELALGQVFQSVAFRYGIERAVEDGWLVPVSQQCVHVEGLDFSSLKTVAGDFSEGELERILTEESILHKIASPVAELTAERPTLVFCCTVKHAELMAAVLERYRPGQVKWLCGATNRDERAAVVESFRDGRLQILCNVGLFLEGFDAPRTAVVVMARPTKSPVLYSQVLGRATRTLPGIVDGLATAEERKAAIAASAKPGCLALDFVGNAGRHKIITAADVLGGKYGVPVRDYARQTVASENKPVAVAEALDRAEAELDLLEEERERRRRITARAEYRTREVSPFDTRQAAAPDRIASPPADPPTDKQVRMLCWLGVSAVRARSYSKRQASVVIDKLMAEKRAREGSPS